jgi:Ni/Co efflux regulator RcnB
MTSSSTTTKKKKKKNQNKTKQTNKQTNNQSKKKKEFIIKLSDWPRGDQPLLVTASSSLSHDQRESGYEYTCHQSFPDSLQYRPLIQ